jgi:integrase
MVIGNALDYACETGVLPINPVKRIKWRKPRTLKTVDPRVVINADQAIRLLQAVGAQGERGKRLVAFFGCMYYAALRPEEAIDLRRTHLTRLPDKGWGEMRLTHSEPRSGALWTDSGKSRERRELKHRVAGENRSVPIHPNLTGLLRDHLSTFPTGRGGRIFVGPRGGTVAERVYLEVFHKTREAAFTRHEATWPLAVTPYALRHAAVSMWLNAGVAPAPSRRVGRPQRGCAATGLRQVHRWSAGLGKAPHRGSYVDRRTGRQPTGLTDHLLPAIQATHRRRYLPCTEPDLALRR